jgi:type 1 fimbria pilin
MRLRNSSGTPIVNGSGQACFSSIAQIGAGGSYNFYGTLELVRISGPILNGSVMNNAAWAFGVYNTNGLLNDDSIDASQIYPAGAITLKSIACTPTFPAVVQLPTINQGALSAGSAGATAFAIGLRCDTGAQVGISLDAAAGLSVIDANNGILSVQTGGGGRGRADRRPTPGSCALAVARRYGHDQRQCAEQLSLLARYIRLGTVTAGAVSSAMTFTFDYQ